MFLENVRPQARSAKPNLDCLGEATLPGDASHTLSQNQNALLMGSNWKAALAATSALG